MLEPRFWSPEQYRPLVQGAFYVFTMGMKGDGLVMSAVGVQPAADTASSNADTSAWTFPKQEIKRVMVDCLKQVPEVSSVCAHLQDDETSVWTLLESYDRSAREKVYEKELEICESLHLYDFDFRVTSIDLVSPKELIEGGLREIYRRQ